jgi:hypothetical protein
MSGDQQGMLFKRGISVPEGVAVELLLQKWNPGLPDYAIEDMLVSVLRWNGLSSFEELQPNQEIVIPTVVPPGLTPRQWRESQKDRPKRQPFQVAGAKFEQAAAQPKGSAVPMTVAPSLPQTSGPKPARAAPPGRPAPAVAARMASPMVHRQAPTAALLEMQLRQTPPTAGPWQASNRPGQTLAGSDVKEQFQRQMNEMIWKKRAMQRPF